MKYALLLALCLSASAADLQRPVAPALIEAVRALPPQFSAVASEALTGQASAVAALHATLSDASLGAADRAVLEQVVAEAQSRAGAQIQEHAEAMAAALGVPTEIDGLPGSLSETDLAKKISTTTRGLKVAKISGAEFRPEYETALKSLGADMISIENPSEVQLDTLSQAQGYYFSPEMLRFMTPKPANFARYIQAPDPKNPDGQWPPTKVRATLRTELKKSAGVEVTVTPLKAAAYREWHPIWMKEVGGKPGAVMVWKLEDAEAHEKAGDMYMVEMRVDGKLVGGSVFKHWKDRGYLSIGAAAYLEEYKGRYQLSVRTFAEAMRLSDDLGLTLVSYGGDYNSYGYDFSLGLNNYKVSVGMSPFPEGPVRLLKVLSGEKFLAPELLDKNGKSDGFFFYAMDRDGAPGLRYRRALRAGQTLKAQDLIGGQYFSAQATPAHELLRPIHLTNDDRPARVPEGFSAIEKKPLP